MAQKDLDQTERLRLRVAQQRRFSEQLSAQSAATRQRAQRLLEDCRRQRGRSRPGPA